MNYQIQMSLKTGDGYSRRIWSVEYCGRKSSKKEDILILQDEELGCQVKCEITEGKYKSLKPLCTKFPISVIEQFYNEKYELMNKSDLLNQIENIGDLKGILYVLTRQNMGSRIIQKLLSKAKQE